MNDDLEAIDGLCAKIIEQRARIEALEKALRHALVELFACSVQLNARKDGSIGRAIDVCRAALAEGQDK